MNRLPVIFLLLVNSAFAQVTVGNLWVGGGGPTTQAEATNYILFIGQSNARGGDGALTTSQSYSNLMWSDGVLSTGDTATEQTLTSLVKLVEGDDRETPATAFSKQLSYLTGSNFIVANYARNGSAYSVIKKGGSGSNYALSIASITNVLLLKPGSRLFALVSFHGESDGDEGYSDKTATWQSDYQTDAVALTSQSGNIPIFHSQCQQASSAHYDGVLRLHETNATKNPCIGPRYWATALQDNFHYTNYSYTVFGEQAAKAIYRHRVLGDTETCLRPIRSVVTNTSHIYLYFTGHVGNLVFDTDNVEDPGNKGFTYVTSGGETISSVTMLDEEVGVVDVALTGAPSLPGNLRIRYAAVGNGNGFDNGARGCLRDSDTTIGLTSGTNLWNWAVHFNLELNWTAP